MIQLIPAIIPDIRIQIIDSTKLNTNNATTTSKPNQNNCSITLIQSHSLAMSLLCRHTGYLERL